MTLGFYENIGGRFRIADWNDAQIRYVDSEQEASLQVEVHNTAFFKARSCFAEAMLKGRAPGVLCDIRDIG